MATNRPTPDFVLAASARILSALLPLLARRSGDIADVAAWAVARSLNVRLLADTRAAARSPTLAADIAALITAYRVTAADQRAVIAGLDRVVTAARSWQPVAATSIAMSRQRDNEIALTGLFEWSSIAAQAEAVAAVAIVSHDEAMRYRRSLGRSLDVAIERASDRGLSDVMRALRLVQGQIARDLIERGRPLARMVGYETAIELPAVVLAHKLYQDAGRADELMAENAGWSHPSFMPRTGRGLSR